MHAYIRACMQTRLCACIIQHLRMSVHVKVAWFINVLCVCVRVSASVCVFACVCQGVHI